MRLRAGLRRRHSRLRRERLVKLLLTRFAGAVRADHRLLLRSAWLRRRRAYGQAVFVDHWLHRVRIESGVAIHLLFGR